MDDVVATGPDRRPDLMIVVSSRRADCRRDAARVRGPRAPGGGGALAECVWQTVITRELYDRVTRDARSVTCTQPVIFWSSNDTVHNCKPVTCEQASVRRSTAGCCRSFQPFTEAESER